MIKKPCPICENTAFLLKENVNYIPAEHKKFFEKHKPEYNILKCGNCGLEFCDPMPTEEVLREFYGKSYVNPRAAAVVVSLNAQKNIRMLKKYGLRKTSRLLDFGCGDNSFVQTGKSKNWTGYDKYISQFSKLGSDYDFITLWGVLEHLTDLTDILWDLARCLNQNGKIVLTTVFSEISGLPYQHKPPEHTFYFTRKSIEILFKKTGFRLLEYSPYFMYQNPDVYFWAVFNAARIPEEIRKKIRWDIKGNVLVPTNEVFVVGEKK